MGCAVILIIVIGALIGLAVLPTIATFTDDWTTAIGSWGTGPLPSIVHLLPFAFLILIIIAAVWVLANLGKGGQ